MGVTLYIMVVGRLPIYNPDLMMFFDDLMEKEIEYPASLSAPLVYPSTHVRIAILFRETEALTTLICFRNSCVAIRWLGFPSMRSLYAAPRLFSV